LNSRWRKCFPGAVNECRCTNSEPAAHRSAITSPQCTPCVALRLPLCMLRTGSTIWGQPLRHRSGLVWRRGSSSKFQGLHLLFGTLLSVLPTDIRISSESAVGKNRGEVSCPRRHPAVQGSRSASTSPYPAPHSPVETVWSVGRIPWRTLWPSRARARSNLQLPQTSSPLCPPLIPRAFTRPVATSPFLLRGDLFVLFCRILSCPRLHHLVCSSYKISSFFSSLDLACDRYSLPADARLLYVVNWSLNSAGLAARWPGHAPTHSAI